MGGWGGVRECGGAGTESKVVAVPDAALITAAIPPQPSVPGLRTVVWSELTVVEVNQPSRRLPDKSGPQLTGFSQLTACQNPTWIPAPPVACTASIETSSSLWEWRMVF